MNIKINSTNLSQEDNYYFRKKLEDTKKQVKKEKSEFDKILAKGLKEAGFYD
jgi:3-methyladenine DNA glycosylase AlkC